MWTASIIHISLQGEDKMFCGSKEWKCRSIEYGLNSTPDQDMTILLEGGVQTGI